MGDDEDGTGAKVVESLWVVSAVAVWRGGWQDKARVLAPARWQL